MKIIVPTSQVCGFRRWKRVRTLPRTRFVHWFAGGLLESLNGSAAQTHEGPFEIEAAKVAHILDPSNGCSWRGCFFSVGPISNDGSVDGHRHGFNRSGRPRCYRHSDQHRDGPDANNEDRGKWSLRILVAFPGHL